jgi:uncharacterized RDD family membrane protein YckC
MPCVNHPTVEENLVKCSRCAKPFCQDCVIELKSNFYCIDCKGEQVRDIQSGADTTTLELAGIGTRFAAVFIDNLIMAIPAVAMMFIFGIGMFAAVGTDIGAGMQILFYVVIALPGLLYEGLMLQMKGQTLGKMACKIKVVTPEGNDISPGQAWMRGLTRVIFNQLGIFSLINYLFAFAAERTTLHDKIAKTRVINWRQ